MGYCISGRKVKLYAYLGYYNYGSFCDDCFITHHTLKLSSYVITVFCGFVLYSRFLLLDHFFMMRESSWNWPPKLPTTSKSYWKQSGTPPSHTHTHTHTLLTLMSRVTNSTGISRSGLKCVDDGNSIALQKQEHCPLLPG